MIRILIADDHAIVRGGLKQLFAMVQDIEVDSTGLVQAPMGPGLGVEIDFERIRRNTQAVLR